MPAASEASRNAAGELGKPPCGSRIPVPRCVETPRRCPTLPWGIACGLPPAELPGYAIVWVPYVGFHPLGRFGEIELDALDSIEQRRALSFRQRDQRRPQRKPAIVTGVSRHNRFECRHERVVLDRQAAIRQSFLMFLSGLVVAILPSREYLAGLQAGDVDRG